MIFRSSSTHFFIKMHDSYTLFMNNLQKSLNLRPCLWVDGRKTIPWRVSHPRNGSKYVCMGVTPWGFCLQVSGSVVKWISQFCIAANFRRAVTEMPRLEKLLSVWFSFCNRESMARYSVARRVSYWKCMENSVAVFQVCKVVWGNVTHAQCECLGRYAVKHEIYVTHKTFRSECIFLHAQSI